MATDYRAADFAKQVDVSGWKWLQQEKLKKKQEGRILELFLQRLKDVKLHFQGPLNEMNKNMLNNPIEKEEVLATLN